ncbi:hypothetical protein IKQ02_04175 [bacterium]|nr:hypothetical protein [bacterium]
MNKFLFSAIIEEVNQEILYTTFNYQKEKMGPLEIKKLGEDDFKNLSKSKPLFKMASYLLEIEQKNQDSKYSFDPEFLKILDSQEYDLKRVKYLIEYMNPYIDYYHKMMHKLIDNISETLDIKERSDGFQGEFPLYLKLTEKSCMLERAIVSTNAKDYLYQTAKSFSYKVTFMDYDVPLKVDYTFNGIDLRNKSTKEVVGILDNSIKVNLNHCKYYETDNVQIDTTTEELTLMNMGEESLWLNKKKVTYSGIKMALKDSLKRTLFTLLIITIITAIILIFKYFMN